MLLGAGASKAAGLPDLAGLQQAALASLEGEMLEQATSLFEGRNLEEVLSRLRRIVSLLGDGEGEFEGLTRDSALKLDRAITRAIIPALGVEKAKSEPFRRLAIWATGASYRLPLEIFTVNYDLLIETALESVGASFFDGFVGTVRAPFRPELVEEFSVEANALPSTFVRVWKLHGSVNWAFEGDGPDRRVVRLGAPATEDEIAAIYPSDEKYSDSRRVPFVVLMDRFRRALRDPETLVLTSGYSFGDEHLNELLFDAAIHRPRSETIAVCYDEIPEVLRVRATEVRNLTVWSKSEAIVGGETGTWTEKDEAPDVWRRGEFLLCDFAHLASYLGKQSAEADAGG
jgi:hypothetical protein